MMEDNVTQDWLRKLIAYVGKKPIVILRFSEEEWDSLHYSSKGASEFTFARWHVVCEHIKKMGICLIYGEGRQNPYAYIGVISSRAAITTLDTRIKVKRALRITPITADALVNLVTEPSSKGILKKRLSSDASVISLSSKLSMHLIGGLAEIATNHAPLRATAEYLSSIKTFKDAHALQEDAVQTALRIFGIATNERAISLEMMAGKETALARMNIMEDGVIEHDARSVPGYNLIKSDVTGRAIFEKNGQQLEIYTANRRPLEKVLGVDLIYFNVTRKNVVMLQYKMLESEHNGDEEEEITDWIYRPDKQLQKEMKRMEQFSLSHKPGKHEYRLNPQIFYLKFVKRDAALSSASIIMPVEHFNILQGDPACKGKGGAFKISYNTLGGRYLRQNTFADLVYSGYIGAHATQTAQLQTLIKAILQDDKAIIAAIQRQK